MRGMLAMSGWAVLTLAGTAWGYQLDNVRVEWWAGSGANRAVLVVDFWPGNGAADSFAFGYRFDGAEITGLNLLDGLQAANGGLSYAQDGGYVTDIWYTQGGTTHHALTEWPDSWVSYWLSGDYGQTWEEAMVGPASRTLHDGDTDGWLAKPGDDWTSAPVTPLAFAPGDMNCDGMVNNQDIDGFLLALFGTGDFQEYRALYPNCEPLLADMSGDGLVNNQDIDGFVAALFAP